MTPPCTDKCCASVPDSPEPKDQSCAPWDMNDPVDSRSGNYYYYETDLTVSNLLAMKALRGYASGLASQIGPFGVGTHLGAYNMALTIAKDPNGKPVTAPNTTLLVNLGNGGTIPFSNGAAGGAYFTSPNNMATLTDNITLSLDGNGYLSYATYRKLSNSQFFFDANGRYIKWEDSHGNYLLLNRDASGRLQNVQDPASGRGLFFAYNADGLISQIADHAGRTVSYTYSAAKELLSVTNPAGAVMQYTWTSDHRIATRKDYKSQTVITNEYDPATGSVVKQTNADGGAYRLSAPERTALRWIYNPDNTYQKFDFNAQGMPTKIIDENGNATSIFYSPNLFTNTPTGKYIEKTDPLSRVTRTDFNANNLPITITLPDNNQYVITYDGLHPHLPASVRDPLWHYTYFTYDASGNLTQIKDHDNKTTTFTYNAKGQTLTRVNALGKTTSYTYNAHNELATITDPLGHVTTFAYDNRGNLTSVTDPRQNVTTFAYDVLNRLTSVTNPLNQATTYTYDNNSNLLTVTDASNHTTTYAYDSRDRMTSVNNPLNQTTTYAYDKQDRMVSATDPKSQTTTYEYDAAGRLNWVNYNGQKIYAMSYDANDELLSIADGDPPPIIRSRNYLVVEVKRRDRQIGGRYEQTASQAGADYSQAAPGGGIIGSGEDGRRDMPGAGCFGCDLLQMAQGVWGHGYLSGKAA
ncbi:MAG: RHS repeat protein [Vampirovibrionales bacterium]|nr:RHS repeat protein [Vampirovibrionales bacterium]